MRVLHIINTAEIGGGGEHLVQLTAALRPRGVESDVVVGRDGPATQRLRAAGVPVTVVGPLGVAAPVRLARVMRSVRPDLLHLHGSRAGFAGAMAAAVIGMRPVIYTAHAFSFKRRLPRPVVYLFGLAERLTCGTSARVVCLTEGDRRAAAARGISTGHFTVIPNGIDVQRFATASHCREEFGFAPTTPVVGLIARLVPDKDPVAFVRVAYAVAAMDPAVRFLLVGDGPLRSEVERSVREMNLQSRIRMTGFRHDVAELLATMDLVVVTSRWEGLPLVVLEAMAASRPVVASHLPGVAEVVIDRETGLLVPPQDPRRLAEAVTALLHDPNRRIVMGQRARARVEREFSVERMIAATVDVYRDALGAASPGTTRV